MFSWQTLEADANLLLIESVINSVTSTSVYNGDGLRMSHTVGMTTTNYVWDVTAGLPVVLDDGENAYVYGLDLISATDSQSDQTYFLYDGLGSVTDVTDENGDVVASYSYDVFGGIRSLTGSSDNYWLFAGEQQDDSSGLYFLRARYYDSGTGRFMTQDPYPGSTGRPETLNRYPYVGGNPVSRVDPSGLMWLSEIGGGGVSYEGGFEWPPLPDDLQPGDVEGPFGGGDGSLPECAGTLQVTTAVQGYAWGGAGEVAVGIGVDDSGQTGVTGSGGLGGGAAAIPLSAS